MTDFSAFDAAVSELTALGYSRDVAEARVRSQLPHLAPAETKGDDRTLEREEQRECWRIYRAHGCIVYSTSQYRPAKVSEGIPDLLVFSPKAHAFFFHEVKRPVGGEQSPAQSEFQKYCAECGIAYVLGDRTAAWAQLRAIGIAEAA